MTEHPKFVTTCEEDEEGNLILPFPEELLEAMGWGDGTTLDIDIIGDRLVLREVIRSDCEEADGSNSGE
jgi:bifunctional DNA-binding transcriptional regulator/antitoxin component of YhaV-PrlF toxin-antitoxin module